MPQYFTRSIPDPVWESYLLDLSEVGDYPEDRSKYIGIPLEAIYSSVAPNAELKLMYSHEGKSLLVVSERFFPNSKPSDKIIRDHIIEPLRERIRELECDKYGFVVKQIILTAREFEERRTESRIGFNIYLKLQTPDLPIQIDTTDYTYLKLSGMDSGERNHWPLNKYVLRDYVNETRSLTGITDAKAFRLAARIGDGLRKLVRLTTHLESLGYNPDE